MLYSGSILLAMHKQCSFWKDKKITQIVHVVVLLKEMLIGVPNSGFNGICWKWKGRLKIKKHFPQVERFLSLPCFHKNAYGQVNELMWGTCASSNALNCHQMPIILLIYQ